MIYISYLDYSLKDIQVPVCPLCNKPVPVNRGESADQRVNEHIDRECQADEKKRRIYANRCSFQGCKKREVLYLLFMSSFICDFH